LCFVHRREQKKKTQDGSRESRKIYLFAFVVSGRAWNSIFVALFAGASYSQGFFFFYRFRTIRTEIFQRLCDDRRTKNPNCFNYGSAIRMYTYTRRTRISCNSRRMTFHSRVRRFLLYSYSRWSIDYLDTPPGRGRRAVDRFLDGLNGFFSPFLNRRIRKFFNIQRMLTSLSKYFVDVKYVRCRYYFSTESYIYIHAVWTFFNVTIIWLFDEKCPTMGCRSLARVLSISDFDVSPWCPV